MVDLSVIIVNYNVRYFLEQCLLSLAKATHHLHIETFVVDNDSMDDSMQMVREKFPDVKLIENKKNVGFSAANNQAIIQSTGKYILLLNPDTILSEDTLITCFNYMQAHDEAGAVCVKMIDGSGQYLPESKRGKPTLTASMFKMTGIYKLFPKSRFFNAYYAGDIDENQEADIEVMTGAFMFLRKSAVEKVGLLDDAFFMYGEDIDYSYRILEAGYINHYLPKTTIIHFKGESTKKSSINYTRIFYNAMIIFVKKHYKGKGRIYILALQLAVVLRAIAALFQVWFSKALPILIDLALIYSLLILVKDWWVNFYFNDPHHINSSFEWFNAPFYSIVWVLTALTLGHYRKISSWNKVFKSITVGTALILIIYGLLDVQYRNSRLLILFGSISTASIFVLTKFFKNLLVINTFGFTSRKNINYAVVGSKSESDRIQGLISSENGKINFQGRITLKEDGEENIGSISHLSEITEAYHIHEVIFSQKDTPAGIMMETMSKMNKEIDFRVAPADALTIISSRSKDKQGELITVGLSFRINSKEGQASKRLLDILSGLILLLISPILIFFQKDKGRYFSNLISVITGKISMVGYARPITKTQLPSIKNGIFMCAFNNSKSPTDEAVLNENIYYAQHYSIWKDMEVIAKNLNQLDGKYI